MAEAFIQVAPDSSGKRIRNSADDAGQVDGTVQTVYTQHVRLCESDRAVLDDIAQSSNRMLAAMLLLLEQMDGQSIEVSDLDSMADNF